MRDGGRTALSTACGGLIATGLILVSGVPAFAFSATFSWRGIPACGRTSPAFSISGAPRGTAALAFVMHDRNAPDFQHGGSTVAYSGSGTVPKGAVSYIGPCPPPGATHLYVWSIRAVDAHGQPLATTTAQAKFP